MTHLTLVKKTGKNLKNLIILFRRGNMPNSHYVPMLSLRKFSDRLCLFNVITGEYKENIKINRTFSKQNFYSDEVETKLNKKIESQFGNLFSNKLSKCSKIIELRRNELLLIKKFLLISIIRSMGSEELLQKEKNFYVKLDEYSKIISKTQGVEYKPIKPPFIEQARENESSFDYWMRTINVILDTDGTPQEILEHPDKTYPAYRWAQVINSGYLAFWDSEYKHDEFVITDIGMTSENELGWNGVSVHNYKKTNFLLSLINNSNNYQEKMNIYQTFNLHKCFTENFMMFPISAKRMIVLIDPFFKFRIVNKDIYPMLKLEELTMIPNENLFYPNTNRYVYDQVPMKPIIYHPDDLYIYEIKKLTSKETRYCNMLFLDRIDTWVGFSTLDKVVRSVVDYKRANSFPYVPRVDYTELYKIINDKYGASIDINTIGGLRKQ